MMKNYVIKIISIILGLWGIYVQAYVAMRITSQSKYPLSLYFAGSKKPVQIAAGGTYTGAVDRLTKIELTGYPDYAINEVAGNTFSGVRPFTIPAEIDDVFAYQAYNANDLTVLRFLINNNMDPVASLSNTTQMKIENNELKSTGILAPTSRLRGGISGTGMQRYKAILPAAVYDGKVDIVKLVLQNKPVDLSQTFAGKTLLEIADFSQSPNKQQIKQLLQS